MAIKLHRVPHPFKGLDCKIDLVKKKICIRKAVLQLDMFSGVRVALFDIGSKCILIMQAIFSQIDVRGMLTVP